MKVLIEVADATQLQLLGDAIRQAAMIRTTAAGVAASGVVNDPAITDVRPDASRLLRVLAEADWLRGVADKLPALVLAEVPATLGEAPHPLGASPAYPSVPVDVAPVPVFSAPPIVPVGDRTPPPATEADLALRALTLSPGARLQPGAAPVDVAGPPVIPSDIEQLETFGMEDEDLA